MNKIKAGIFLLFLVLTLISASAQNQDIVKKIDTITPVSSVLDTITPVSSALDTITPVSSVLDSINPVSSALDTIPVKEEIKTPLNIDLSKPNNYTIGGVTVTGNQTISEQSILIFSGLVAGQEIKIPGDKLTGSIKKLWNSKLFSNVDIYATKMDGNDIYLEINVSELDKVGNVTIKGIKKSKIEELSKEIEFQKGSMLTENLVTTTKNQIQDKYKEKGFLNTKVTISTKLDTSNINIQDALILVDQGEKIKIKNITFHGNSRLDDKKLKRQLKKTKENTLINIFKSSKYIEDLYTEDLDKVIEKYQEVGFRDAVIIKDSISFNDDNTINLDITVNEGDRYKFGEIAFLGNTVFTDQQLQSLIQIEDGVTYNGKLLNERVKGDGTPDSKDITNTYLDNGYLFSRVNLVETSAENNTIDIEVRIVEDEAATINKVTVTGNDVTNDHVLYREIWTRPGDLFSKSNIIRSIRELGQLGFIDAENIVPDVQPNYAEKTTDIEYSLSEKGSSQIELQGGYGGGAFVGTLALSFNNFSIKNIFNWDKYKPVPRGDGQSISLRLQASKFSRVYSLSFSEPWWGGKRPKGFNFSIYNSRQYSYNPYEQDVDKDQRLDITGASIGLSQRLKWPDDYFTLSTSLNYQRFDLQDFFLSTFGYNNGISNNVNFSINFGRNSAGPSPIYPRHGSQFNVIAEITPPYSSFNNKDYSVMTDEEKFEWLEYYKINFNGKWYTQIWKDLILMSNAEFGFLGAYNDDIGVSPFERFYVGGDGMATGQFDGRQVVALRGYPNSSLTSVTGGTVYNKIAFELRYAITLKPSASIYALTFLEGGNSFDSFENFKPFVLKRSAGAGIRVFMPAFGLLGIDFGYGFDNIPGTFEKSGWQTHFIIGQQF